MNPRQIIVILLALAAAVVALVLVRGMMAPAPTPQSGGQVVPLGPFVLVADRAIGVGEIAQASDFRWVEMTQAALAEDFITREQQPQAIEELTGDVARVAIAKGEVIFASRLVDVGDRSFMTALLEPGYRAVSVPISPETAVAGFILPNDRVDVILTARLNLQNTEGGESVVRSDVILADIKVLAIDQTINAQVDDNGKTSTVSGAVATLSLSPKDAEVLAMAKQLGSLSLALRGLREGQPNQAAPVARSGASALQQSVNVNSVVLLHAGGEVAPMSVRGR